MSLEIDGVWKGGLWASTVWAEGVWREGSPAEAQVIRKITAKYNKTGTNLSYNVLSPVNYSPLNTVNYKKE